MKKLIIICLFSFFGMSLSFGAHAVYNKNLVQNGDFENGLTAWSCEVNNVGGCAVGEFVTPDESVGGYYLNLGGVNAQETVTQDVDIPHSAGKVKFSFMMRFTPAMEAQNDSVQFKLTAADCKDSCVSQTIQFGDAKYDEWQFYEFDITPLKGQTVRIQYTARENGDGQYSWTNIDDVIIRAKSYSTLKGTVINRATGKKVKRAIVKVKTRKGKILWSGKTGLKGKFKAKHIKGGSKNKKIHIKKGDYKKTFSKSIKWGKLYTSKFRINREP